jgi:hypothetical protein
VSGLNYLPIDGGALWRSAALRLAEDGSPMWLDVGGGAPYPVREVDGIWAAFDENDRIVAVLDLDPGPCADTSAPDVNVIETNGIAGADQLAGALPSPLTPPNRHQPTRSQP